MNTTTVAHEEPHLSIRLEYMADEGEGPLALAKQAITALDAMATGWLEPLAWEMHVGCLDTELMDTPMHPKPQQPSWLLRKERIPSGIKVRPIYGNHTVVSKPMLSSEQMHAWAAQGLAQTYADAPRFIPYWESLDCLAMRARLPGAVEDTTHESLMVSCYAGQIAVPLEHCDGQVWVSGPLERYLIGPPVSLAASSLYGMVINLDLAVYWSSWLEQPGRALVDAAVERVLALGRGWRRSEG